MNLVLEGADASGKSTLARYISEHLDWPVVSSDGPEKYPGEILERIRRYSDMTRTIFDRHPVVSQTIYSRFRDHSNTPIPQFYQDLLYKSSVLVYCYTDLVLPHEVKEHDSDDHLAMINLQLNQIRLAYYEWALEYADLIYCVGDPKELILASIKKVIQRCSTP